ncbi:MAG: argininosuccinate lyase [Candidatus Micrarchaeia archaeon]|jgi:argininosuccinate lyase
MKQTPAGSLLWGKGYSKISAGIVDFCASGDWAGDLVLLPAEIELGKAHAKMLHAQKLIGDAELKAILSAFSKLEKGGSKLLSPSEDIHTSIDIFLANETKGKSGNFRLALSRNDEVVTAEHIYLKKKAKEAQKKLAELSASLTSKAHHSQNIILAGYTHHQQALPTTFSHLLLAFAHSFERDAKKFEKWAELHDECPLGAGTGFGTTLPISTAKTAKLLSFSKPHANSIDVITNRWELESDFAYCLASAMTHLSILAQTLILFSTSEFSYIELGDKLSTGSSAMPHKKNPDVLEAIKGKTAKVQASLLAILSTAKSNMAGYNKDTQFGKHELFEAIDETLPSIEIMSTVIAGIKLNQKKMLSSLSSATTSLSVAENLALKHHVPFKSAKAAVEKALAQTKGGKITAKALAAQGITASDSELSTWQNPKWAAAQATRKK